MTADPRPLYTPWIAQPASGVEERKDGGLTSLLHMPARVLSMELQQRVPCRHARRSRQCHVAGSSGTEPGMFEPAMKLITAIIARRPFFSSEMRPRALGPSKVIMPPLR